MIHLKRVLRLHVKVEIRGDKEDARILDEEEDDVIQQIRDIPQVVDVKIVDQSRLI